jgi:hypothetical protein
MITELFSADLFEYQEMFASPIATAVFVYATTALMMIYAGIALFFGRQAERRPPLSAFSRAI